MADNSSLVTISGAALSLLLYENVRSAGDQMGFLLGELVEYIVKKYTDAENQEDMVKRHINIETVVTCSMPDILQDSTGRVDKEKLKDFLSDKGKQVIGWFRFRKNTCLSPTLRDKILHKQFASYFCNSHDYTEELFITCLLSSSISQTHGTHKFRHVFLRNRRGNFEPIPLRIYNLGDDASRHDGSDYKPTPLMTSTKDDTFTKKIRSLKLDLTQTSGVEVASIIEKEAEKYLNTLIPKVCESDREVAELEKQVQELREKIFARHFNVKTKVNGNSDEVETYSDIEMYNDTEEKDLSPERSHVSDVISENDQLYKYDSTVTDQPIAYKSSNVDVYTQNTTWERSKKVELNVNMHTNENRDPFGNAISDTKPHKTDSTLNRNKYSEISRQAINVGEHVESGMGRGSSRYDASSMRKTKRASASEIGMRGKVNE